MIGIVLTDIIYKQRIHDNKHRQSAYYIVLETKCQANYMICCVIYTVVALEEMASASEELCTSLTLYIYYAIVSFIVLTNASLYLPCKRRNTISNFI